MADPASGGGAEPAATPSGSPLLFYLAIGRLASNREGELLPEKHRLVAHNFGRKGDPDPDWAKSIKSHLKAVMKRAGHKLAPGKRIRLKDDAGNYEVHILTDEAEGDRTKTLVFFAVTAIDFPKLHSVPSLLKDLKSGFYATVDAGTLWNGGSVQRACQPYFQRIMTHYASSPLAKVQVKVEAVRDVMQNSVARALSSVENLEDMDEKAELFEDKSKTFYKRTEAVKVQERSKYRKLTCLLATLIIAIIAYFVITAVVKYRSSDSESGGGEVVADSSTGDALVDSSSSSSSSSSTGDAPADSSSSTGAAEEESSTGGEAPARRRLLAMAREASRDLQRSGIDFRLSTQA